MSRLSRFLPVLAFIGAMSFPVLAGEGHDHGAEPATPSGNGPRRLPDGSVFLPKPAQRQIGVRTLAVEGGEHPKSRELSGRVVMDPNAGGKVQALVAGRLEPGPKGFPGLGQSVAKGEVLAYVVPSSSAFERSGQTAQLAELRAAKEVADARLVRLRELSDTVPRKELEAAESEARSLAARVAAVGGALAQRDALVAPVSGEIASAHAVAGQVVDARELVFEVVDSTRLRIEALAYDAAEAADIAGGAIVVGGKLVPLVFIGAARSLREQALPVMFRAEGPALAGLAVGQPVKVYARGAVRVKGIRVPAATVTRSPSNESIVWVKTAPERFEPRRIVAQPLDGASVAVTSGLAPGDRIVTAGAALVNQIR